MSDQKAPDFVDSGRPRVEIYHPVSGRPFAYRVIAVAEDGSAKSLRAAKALALEVEQELFEDLESRAAARKGKRDPK